MNDNNSACDGADLFYTKPKAPKSDKKTLDGRGKPIFMTINPVFQKTSWTEKEQATGAFCKGGNCNE